MKVKCKQSRGYIINRNVLIILIGLNVILLITALSTNNNALGQTTCSIIMALLGALVLVEQAHSAKLRQEKALMSLSQAEQENRHLKQQAQIKQQKYNAEVKRLISALAIAEV